MLRHTQVSAEELSYNGEPLSAFVPERTAAYISQARPRASGAGRGARGASLLASPAPRPCPAGLTEATLPKPINSCTHAHAPYPGCSWTSTMASSQCGRRWSSAHACRAGAAVRGPGPQQPVAWPAASARACLRATQHLACSLPRLALPAACSALHLAPTGPFVSLARHPTTSSHRRPAGVSGGARGAAGHQARPRHPQVSGRG